MDISDYCLIVLITFKEHDKPTFTLRPKYKRTYNEANIAKFRLVVSGYPWTDILLSVVQQKAFTLFSEFISQANDLLSPWTGVSQTSP